MIKTLEKHWLFISILFVAAILASLFFWPAISRPLGMFILIVSVVMVIVFAVWQRIRDYRGGRIDNLGLLRNVAIDLLGILLVMTIAVFSGRLAGTLAVQAASGWAAVRWSGNEVSAGVLAGIATALAVGLCVGWVVQSLWSRLVKSFVSRPTAEKT